MAAAAFQRLQAAWEAGEALFTQVWNTLLPDRSKVLALEVARDLLKRRFAEQQSGEGGDGGGRGGGSGGNGAIDEQVFFGLCPELADGKLGRFAAAGLLPQFIGARIGNQAACTAHDGRYIAAQLTQADGPLAFKALGGGGDRDDGDDDDRGQALRDAAVSLVSRRQHILFCFLADIITVVNKYIAQNPTSSSTTPAAAAATATAATAGHPPSLPSAIRFGGEYAAAQRKHEEDKQAAAAAAAAAVTAAAPGPGDGDGSGGDGEPSAVVDSDGTASTGVLEADAMAAAPSSPPPPPPTSSSASDSAPARARGRGGVRSTVAGSTSPGASASPPEQPLLLGIHHAAIICSDYPVSRRFYTETLGLRVVAEHYRAARQSWKLDLALGDGSQVELFSFPDPPARVSRPEAQGLRHLAFRVADLDAACAALRAKGVASLEAVRVDEYTGKRFTFLADPDGLPLELYEA